MRRQRWQCCHSLLERQLYSPFSFIFWPLLIHLLALSYALRLIEMEASYRRWKPESILDSSSFFDCPLFLVLAFFHPVLSVQEENVSHPLFLEREIWVVPLKVKIFVLLEMLVFVLPLCETPFQSSASPPLASKLTPLRGNRAGTYLVNCTIPCA